MAYTTIDNPELYFQAVLYTGNQSTQAITFDGSEDMQPDWVWVKQRADDGYSHELFDSVRGVTKYIVADTNASETTGNTTLTAFGSDGFTLGADTIVNKNTKTYVSWNWKMGTAFSNDASATSVGSIDSSGSINTTAGQSIISWTGTGSAATIAHGLSAVPRMIIVKNRDDTDNWYVYHYVNGNTHSLLLDTNDAKVGAYTDNWNNTTPTSSVFSVGGSAATSGASNEKMISYCFTDVKGYSKIGKYTGNGNANGPMIFTGFKPAWILAKAVGAADNWTMWDNKRGSTNVVQAMLRADTNQVEANSSSYQVDLLSSGFKWRSNDSKINANGSVYAYLAFAESPFVNSNKLPNNAR